jgi:hypothetical protein
MELSIFFALLVAATWSLTFGLLAGSERLVDRRVEALRGPRSLDGTARRTRKRRVLLFVIALWLPWLPLLWAPSSWHLGVLLAFLVLGVLASLWALFAFAPPPRLYLTAIWPLLIAVHAGVLLLALGGLGRESWRRQLLPQQRTEMLVRELGLALEARLEGDRSDRHRLTAGDATGNTVAGAQESSAQGGIEPRAVVITEYEDGEPVLRLDPSRLELVSPSTLERLLRDQRAEWARVSTLRDGWGWPIEVRMGEQPTGGRLVLVRSPGRDGRFEAEAYELGVFAADDQDRDLVWAAGLLWREPVVG